MALTVAVVIPTFNRWPTVCRAIDSVLSQSRVPDEIIVVDDGSNDHTACKLKARYDGQITVLEQTNRGVSAARNIGIAQSSADWVALLDSDDEWLSKKLAMQIALVRENHNCVLCHTDEIWIRNGVRVNPMLKHKKYGGDVFQHSLSMCVISPSSALIRKSLIEQLGGFDESLPACEDYDLWLRVCANHEVHYVNQPLLIKYGGHEDQLSRKYWGMDRFRIQALRKLLDQQSLQANKRRQAHEMLGKKTQILLNGAVKHGNDSLVKECQTMISQYGLLTTETRPC